MKKTVVLVLLIAAAFAPVPARASILFVVTDALTLSDPTQQGRLSRNGIPQDWIGSEPFPGVINAGTTYHYRTYSINVGNAPFIQIELDSTPNMFVSAYYNNYDPTSKGTNWLGDSGFSEPFGVDSAFFQVVVPVNGIISVVLNNTLGANGGVGDAFHLTVEGFIDTEFDDPPPTVTPEPTYYAAISILLAAIVARRILKSKVPGVPQAL